MSEVVSDMENIYAWTEVAPGGKEGVIVAAHPLFGGVMIPLQHRQRDIAEAFRPIAVQHHERTGHRVRFVRFARAEVLDD